MRRLPLLAVLALAACSSSSSNPCTGWMQWSQSAAHDGDVCLAAQTPAKVLAQAAVDPFATFETSDDGDLLVHYPVPLIVGDDVYFMHKLGMYSEPCQPTPDGSEQACHFWDTQIWTEERWHWKGAKLEFVWSVGSDWHPVPSEVSTSEPLFQPVVVGDNLYVPAAAGAVDRVNRTSGLLEKRIDQIGRASCRERV